MNIVAYSDIHACYAPLAALYNTLPSDYVHWCLGDLVGRNQEPVQVVRAVQAATANGGFTLIGNHDACAVGKSPHIMWGIPEQKIALRHGEQIMQADEPLWRWLRGLEPQTVPLAGFFAAHDFFELYPPKLLEHRQWVYATRNQETRAEQMDNLLLRSQLTQEPVRALLFGHSHVPYLGVWDGTAFAYRHPFKKEWYEFDDLAARPVMLNVGSVALPRQGSPACYVLLEVDEHHNALRVGFRELAKHE